MILLVRWGFCYRSLALFILGHAERRDDGGGSLGQAAGELRIDGCFSAGF